MSKNDVSAGWPDMLSQFGLAERRGDERLNEAGDGEAAIGVTVTAKETFSVCGLATVVREPSLASSVHRDEELGIEDVCIDVCDGLKGSPEAIGNTWPLAIVQTCVLHLIRNTFRSTRRSSWRRLGRVASKADWDKMSRDLRPVYTAVSEHEAKERFVDFTGTWGEKSPAIVLLWENTRAEFVPFLDDSPEIRKVIYAANAVSRCTRGCGEPPGLEAISPPNKRPSYASTWSCVVSTQPERENDAGQ